jgi:hypothetical protein
MTYCFIEMKNFPCQNFLLPKNTSWCRWIKRQTVIWKSISSILYHKWKTWWIYLNRCTRPVKLIQDWHKDDIDYCQVESTIILNVCSETKNSSDTYSAEPLHRHHRRIEFMSSSPKCWYKNYAFLRRYVTTTSQPHFFIFLRATMKPMGCAPTMISSQQIKTYLTPVCIRLIMLWSRKSLTGACRPDHFTCHHG